MKSRFRALVVAVALVLPCAAIPVTPANAANADVFVMQGSGTMSPGLGLTPAPQSMSFTATAAFVGTDGILATYACHFVGNDLAGSLAEGVGTLSGNCGPISFSTCVFVRVGPVWVWVCVGITITASVKCTIVVRQIFPTTDFDATCEAEVVVGP